VRIPRLSDLLTRALQFIGFAALAYLLYAILQYVGLMIDRGMM